MNHNNIENIIFDLGGVIINLDINQTFRKFSQIFKKEINADIFADHEKYRFFRDYEVGSINDEEFRNSIKSLADFPIEDDLIDEAWIAMLQDIPQDRIGWIYEATQKYNCVVLSNTNHIHINYFEEYFNKVIDGINNGLVDGRSLTINIRYGGVESPGVQSNCAFK